MASSVFYGKWTGYGRLREIFRFGGFALSNINTPKLKKNAFFFFKINLDSTGFLNSLNIQRGAINCYVWVSAIKRGNNYYSDKCPSDLQLWACHTRKGVGLCGQPPPPPPYVSLLDRITQSAVCKNKQCLLERKTRMLGRIPFGLFAVARHFPIIDKR